MSNENLKLQIKELKKQNEELQNSNVEKEKLLLFYRKTTLELNKEREENG